MSQPTHLHEIKISLGAIWLTLTFILDMLVYTTIRQYGIENTELWWIALGMSATALVWLALIWVDFSKESGILDEAAQLRTRLQDRSESK